MHDWSIAADDRTGALEVAGMSADVGTGPVLVVAHRSSDHAARMPAPTTSLSSRMVVVDLDSRHLDPGAAALRAIAVDDDHPAHALGHKIDSTLRGNWHHEVVARAIALRRRVVVVPAFPALGRTCVHGVVMVDGVPVGDGPAGRDALDPARCSKPAELLGSAGATDVEELRDGAAVRRWLAGGSGRFGVCDASTDDDLHAIAAAWAPHAVEVLFAGTGAALAAAVSSRAPGGAGARVPTDGAGRLPGPVLVVCGSLHPVARRQLDLLRVERPDIEVLTTPRERGTAPIDHTTAEQVAVELARAAQRRLADGRHGTVVVIGGDTAAAILGDRPVLVGGTIATGLPWLRSDDGEGPLVLTRSGGFGDERSLVELLGGPSR